jgi:hypothetical protein
VSQNVNQHLRRDTCRASRQQPDGQDWFSGPTCEAGLLIAASTHADEQLGDVVPVPQKRRAAWTMIEPTISTLVAAPG